MPASLPPGWAVTPLLEVVPDPNAATMPIAAGPGFARWTYIGTNEHGQTICASGSLEDCESQIQALAECRTQKQPYDEAI